MFEEFSIPSPKQSRNDRTGWDSFFPYYAGYPASFAKAVIESARLPGDAVVLDPWNGSGTTTHTASRLGFRAVGVDLNPVMVIVSRARCLPPGEGDSIEPLTSKILATATETTCRVNDDDPLLGWFDQASSETIRRLESAIRQHLLGRWTLRNDGTHFECISSLAATFYVALFLTCRSLVSPFQSSNPTWLRRRKNAEPQIRTERAVLFDRFRKFLEAMSTEIAAHEICQGTQQIGYGAIDIHLLDTTKVGFLGQRADFVLTSPPYCTRIDYTAATRIELAIISPILNETPADLSRRMIGSTRVPTENIIINAQWGETCQKFLSSLASHKSKASSGYYLKTHLDYFDKLWKSLGGIRVIMNPGARAVFVVQDSYYKDLHNDLPRIVCEMAAERGLRLIGSKEFRLNRSMSGVNPYTRIYKRRTGALEAVLGFVRDS